MSLFASGTHKQTHVQNVLLHHCQLKCLRLLVLRVTTVIFLISITSSKSDSTNNNSNKSPTGTHIQLDIQLTCHMSSHLWQRQA